MGEIIKIIKELNKQDRIVLFLIGSTIINLLAGTIKFVLSLTIPSMWFFVNALFSLVLACCRFLTIRKYGEIRTIKDKAKKIELGYSVYIKNGILLILVGIAYFFVSSYMYYKGTNNNMH